MTSYLTHFGLKKAPFATHVVGSNVFVSPQVATVMAGLKKALASEDAIVCLSGPVGAGKTTIAKRALDGVGKNRGIVTIGRMPFGHDEVLEILLAGLGAKQLPKSTVHRFATFRRLLQQFAEQQTRVFILVEDAARIGLGALSELEALTAADAGVSNGANLILLGDDSLSELLREPKLARLKQRVRSRQNIAAQSASELQGYLKHSFRLAGREFDTIFADGSARSIAGLTDGLPRVVNNLLEAVLIAAAEQGLERIPPAMIERIALDEFGLTLEHNVSDIVAAIDKAAAAEADPAPLPKVEVEAIRAPEPAPAPAPAAVHEADDDNIPELIQDTLPDLQILAPELAAAAHAAPETVHAPRPVLKPKPPAAPPPEPEPVYDPTENELPVLSTSMRLNIAARSADEATSMPAEARDEDGKLPSDIPAWDRDPTLAELRPDLEALERAMQVAQGNDDAPPSVEAEVLAQAAAPAAAKQKEAAVEIIPEITLDKQIEAKIHEATEALKKTNVDATAEIRSGSDASNDDESGANDASEPPLLSKPAASKPAANKPVANKPVADKPVANKPAPEKAAAVTQDRRKSDRKLDKIASGLAKAKTIEDVDDFMAETLFGEEFSMLAAQVAANASLQFAAGQESEVASGETMGSAALSLVDEAPPAAASPNVDTSPSQRLKVLRDLNRRAPPRGAPETPEPAECIVMSGGGVDAPRGGDDVAVDSIEDQITTSMTQTLRTLSIRPEPISDADDDDDGDDDESGKGFFSRFRRK